MTRFSLPIKDLSIYDPQNIKSDIFTTVYLGSYESNSSAENAGSHCGVDISTRNYPDGITEIYAITDGEVVKAKEGTTGFGNHIVIKHENVSDPDNPVQKITIFSCYNHLSKINVKENQKVIAGEIIGLSGSSGTSTSPHLHFQIDNEKADWHPFWPFSTQEATAAGLNFFEAVCQGLGQAKAKECTINPLVYIQNQLDGNAHLSLNKISSLNKIETDSVAEKKLVATAGTLDSVVEEKKVETEVDKNVDKLAVKEELKEKVEEARVEEKKEEEGIIKKITFPDVLSSHSNYEAIFWLVGKGSVKGYLDGTFRPEKTVTRAELLKMVMELYKVSLVETKEAMIFQDVKSNDWFAPYVYTAAQKSWSNGYAGGLFKPHNEVTRAEGFKIIFKVADIAVPKNVRIVSAQDVPANHWSAPYIEIAFEKKLLDFKDNQFLPNAKLTRGELAEILYRLSK